VDAWLGRPEFAELKRTYLHSAWAKEILSSLMGKSLVSRLVGEHTDRTWALLMLSIWLHGRALES
jgi:hypothetical protein